MDTETAFHNLLGMSNVDLDWPGYGVDDPATIQIVLTWIKEEMNKEENKYRGFPKSIEPLVREWFMSDEAIEQGSGAGDVAAFFGWFSRISNAEDQEKS